MERPLTPHSNAVVASLIQEIENLDATSRPSDTMKAQNSRFPLHVKEKRAPEIKPRVVSIGPFCHRDPAFEAMERKKLEFIKSIKHDIPSLSNLFQEVLSSVVSAREFYSEPINLNDYAFAKMLLVDSCFIIGFLASLSIEMEECLVSLDWSINEIRSDLLLLENQIPIDVVCGVYHILRTSCGAYSKLPADFNHILAPFICMDIPWGFPEVPPDEARHLLHYYWLWFLPNLNDTPKNRAETQIPVLPPQDSRANWAEHYYAPDVRRNIPSATELYRVAGVDFKNRSHKEGFVTRFHNGLMEMPSLKIDESRKIILTNLVGFEKSLKLSERKVSSYMTLMDSLINTEEDVALLQKCGIICNGLNNNSSAAEFFNEMGSLCTINYRSHLFGGLFKDVNEYYESVWNRRFASLQHNYFSNPWAGISVAAAGFLLILTVIQTILGAIQTHYTIHPQN